MIRLTLILTAGIVGSMLILGSGDETLETDPIAETVLRQNQPDSGASEVEFLAAGSNAADVAVVATTGEPANAVVDVTRQQTLDLASPQKPALLVLEARDAPAAEIAAVPDTRAVPDGMLYVTGTRVNMRAGPSTNDSVVGSLQRGARAELLADTRDGWLQIRDISTGAEGYMSARFLSPLSPG